MRAALAGAAMRGPVRAKPRQTFTVEVLPPPIGGWNRRDAAPLMKPTDALRLDNWIPDTNNIILRPGYSTHATIQVTATAVESLIQYLPPNTSSKQLFAAIPSAVYDVTAAVTASSTAAVVTGLSNARWQYDQLTNTSGSYLGMCNGADPPRLYNGTAWTTLSVTTTGLTISNLISLHTHMNRWWLIEENQNHVWYLATSAIAGPPTKFLLPFRKGGKLMAMGTWTRDGGAGLDDLAVFVSDRGECVIYSGYDPNTVGAWSHVGTHNIPEVIGRRCLINAGADLGILTSQGLVPLSQVLGMSPGADQKVSITNKISGQFRSQFRTTGTAFGWEVVEYPRKNLLIVNVPITERSTQHQYVMNINTGAWCRFKDINAGCWQLFGNDIYFGGNDAVVRKFDTGTLDGSSNITGAIQSAYSILGSPKTKRFSLARPLFIAPTAYDPPVSVLTDYDTSEPTVNTVVASSTGTQWDAGQWDTFQWAGGAQTSLGWQGIKGQGRAVSIAFGVSSSEEIIYNGADIGFEPGNYL